MPPAGKGVDPKLISAVDMRNLCRATLDAVRRFYDNPENLAAYKRWKAEREGALNAEARQFAPQLHP